MYRYPLLIVFLIFCSSAYTSFLYSITQNPWVSVFLTSAAANIFIMENMDLYSKLDETKKEMEIVKMTSNLTLLPKINKMQEEINQLKLYITQQPELHKNIKSSRSTSSTHSL